MKRSRSVSTPPPSDFTKPRPRLPPGVSWEDGLTHGMSDSEQVFEEDDLTVTLFDAFPKARYHYLVVPREDIHSVKELTRDNLELLKHIHKVADELIERVCRKEPNTPFRFGYHAVPSLKRLHLHIISQDFNSPKLKKKHHWNTFNTEYFMDSSKVIKDIEKDGKIEVNDEAYEALLKQRMKCNTCSERFYNISQLKSHLQEHYSPSRLRASRIRRPAFVPKNAYYASRRQRLKSSNS